MKLLIAFLIGVIVIREPVGIETISDLMEECGVIIENVPYVMMYNQEGQRVNIDDESFFETELKDVVDIDEDGLRYGNVEDANMLYFGVVPEMSLEIEEWNSFGILINVMTEQSWIWVFENNNVLDPEEELITCDVYELNLGNKADA
jgi:hypothetical protein